MPLNDLIDIKLINKKKADAKESKSIDFFDFESLHSFNILYQPKNENKIEKKS